MVVVYCIDDFVEWRVEVKRESWIECGVRCVEFTVSLCRAVVSVLRDDLKMDGTLRTCDFCSGEKLENSTLIQVHLSPLWSVFQCTHHPPRARSTITQEYDSESDDQVQFKQQVHLVFSGGQAELRTWSAGDNADL